MSETDFRPYQQFPTPGAAHDLLALLEEHDVPFQTSRSVPNVEPSFSFDASQQAYVVHLRPADFARANALQDEENRQLIAQADPGHYLFSFTDQELMDVLVHRADWSRYDVQLAEHLLRQRGHAPEVRGLEQLQMHRAQQPLPPPPSHPTWIIVGYVVALLGGVGGILLGWHLYSHRQTLPDGQERHAFSPQDRVHGMWIMTFGLLVLVASIVLRVLGG